jgi:hypothetical protein
MDAKVAKIVRKLETDVDAAQAHLDAATAARATAFTDYDLAKDDAVDALATAREGAVVAAENVEVANTAATIASLALSGAELDLQTSKSRHSKAEKTVDKARADVKTASKKAEYAANRAVSRTSGVPKRVASYNANWVRRGITRAITAVDASKRGAAAVAAGEYGTAINEFSQIKATRRATFAAADAIKYVKRANSAATANIKAAEDVTVAKALVKELLVKLKADDSAYDSARQDKSRAQFNLKVAKDAVNKNNKTVDDADANVEDAFSALNRADADVAAAQKAVAGALADYLAAT